MFLLLLHNNLDFYPRSRDILRRYILKHDVIIVGVALVGGEGTELLGRVMSIFD